jgi:hypothetical protein
MITLSRSKYYPYPIHQVAFSNHAAGKQKAAARGRAAAFCFPAAAKHDSFELYSAGQRLLHGNDAGLPGGEPPARLRFQPNVGVLPGFYFAGKLRGPLRRHRFVPHGNGQVVN